MAYRVRGEWAFAPSRYIGYWENTLEDHSDERYMHGGHTNKAISKVLGREEEASAELDEHYRAYCRRLGMKPSNRRRKFWTYEPEVADDADATSLEPDAAPRHEPDASGDYGFPEGRIVERIHRDLERNATVVSKAKRRFKERHGNLACEVCGFDFEVTYGDEYIEAHHMTPLSETTGETITQMDDLAMVCANCHRMLHRARPWLSIKELQDRLRERASAVAE